MKVKTLRLNNMVLLTDSYQREEKYAKKSIKVNMFTYFH